MTAPSPEPLPAVADRDAFLRHMVGELARTLEDVLGASEAEGLVRAVGLRLGEAISRGYPTSAPSGAALAPWIGDVLVDLKRRIRGGFRVHAIEGTRIELVNDACPFAEHALGRPALCQMTTAVFGVLASDRAGFARVRIDEAIARGDGRCRVIVELDPVTLGVGTEFYR